jgi:transposase-like protein
VIKHAVWLHHCFSLRDVETILAARGVVVSYESIREWGLHFGRLFANPLKRRRPKPGDKWHLDEVFLRIRGEVHYLWRAVDQHGLSEQPRRGVTPTHEVPRTADAAVQVSPPRPALLVQPRPHP